MARDASLLAINLANERDKIKQDRVPPGFLQGVELLAWQKLNEARTMAGKLVAILDNLSSYSDAHNPVLSPDERSELRLAAGYFAGRAKVGDDG